MPLDYDRLMALPPIETEHRFTERDTILYALGVGATDLRHVYEDGLAALPTMAAVLAYPGVVAMRPDYKLDWRRMLHVGQSVELHRPIPVSGHVRGVTTIEAIYDKGTDRGAVMIARRCITDAASGAPIATLRSTSLLRGDGGFGARTDDRPPAPPLMPDREPDVVAETPTRGDQALLYRLSGDLNPLHIDPAVARGAGFDRPILHGLCTYGIAARVLLDMIGTVGPVRIARIEARFSAPVFPGETLRTDIWREGEGRVAFRVRAAERDIVVLSHGDCAFS